jgi:hypothetical protein
MRFPLRLAATLYSHKFARGVTASPILCFSPLANHFGHILRQEDVTPEMQWHIPEACVAAAIRAKARIVWLGDSEPLLHPDIGKVVAALLQTGRYVFLHTSGFGLRKRIHEFQPDPRLFLTIEVPSDQQANSLGLTPSSALQQFREAVDGAGLSGFHRCAHMTVDAQSDVGETEQWFDWLRTEGLEGFVVSPGSLPATSAEPAVLKKLSEIRNLIPSRGWRNFSRLLQEARCPLQQSRVSAFGPLDRDPIPPANNLSQENALTQ